MTLLKHEPSAQSPCAKTMLGLCSADTATPPESNRLDSGRRYVSPSTIAYVARLHLQPRLPGKWPYASSTAGSTSRSSARDATPSLGKRRYRCVPTVRGDR